MTSDLLRQLKAALHNAQRTYDSVRARKLVRLIDAELLRLNGQF